MRRIALAALLFSPVWAQEKESRKPQAIRTENIPPVPNEIFERLTPYRNVRSAALEDIGGSPDHPSILISTRFGNTPQLHIVSEPGGDRRQITFFDEPVSRGRFTSGGIVFAMGKGGDENFQIYRHDKSGPVLLTDGKSRNQMGALNRRQTKLVYSSTRRNGRDSDLYVLDTRTGESELLLEVKNEFWHVLDWSGDDSRMLIQQYVSVNESYPFVMDVRTRAKKQIPIGKGACESLRFSIDGKSAYMASDAKGEFRQLARINLETDKIEWLTGDIPWDVTDIEVGIGKVAFVVNEDGRSRLFLLEEGKRREVPIELGVVGGLRVSEPRGELYFTLQRPHAPGDVYSYRDKLIRWTESEVGGLDESRFVRPELIRAKSFDGLEVPAYVFRPGAKDKKVPVIISIHGGPEAQYRPNFSAMTQYWLNELGCAVIHPNVRGSTGYGKTYTTLDNGVKREDAVKDIGAILDWIATQSDLDASRVAVIGGSYGGYMVLGSLVNFPDRIRAGVDIVGISNFITFLEKTSAYRQDLRRAEYGDERDPEVRKVLEKISPANRVDQIKSKLFVIHGKNDPRVPVGEALQIAAKVPGTWLMIADNEGHGFARRENRDYLDAATVLFFKKHLLE